MLTRTFFFKLEKIHSRNIEDLRSLNAVLEYTICYMINKVLVNDAFDKLDITYKYKSVYSTYNAHVSQQDIYGTNIHSVMDNVAVLIRTLEQTVESMINSFNMYNIGLEGNLLPNQTVLNFNSTLINTDTLIVTCELLDKGVSF